MSTPYTLQIGGVRDVVWRPSTFRRAFRRTLPTLYVKVTLDDTDQTEKTRTIKSNLTPQWNQRISLSSADSLATLRIKVKHDASFGHDPCIACRNIRLDKLLEMCKDGEVEIDLQMPHGEKHRESAGTLRLCLEASTTMRNAENDVQAALQAVEIVQPTTVDRVAEREVDDSDMYKALGELYKKLDMFIQVMDVVSEVHPYLSVAWRLSSALFRAVSKQVEADEKFIELVQSMHSAFDFVNEADTLRNRCRSLDDALVRLLKQTSECCRFVQQYTSLSFIGRIMDPTLSAKIDEFMQALSDLRANVNSGLNLYVALVLARVSDAAQASILDGRLKSSSTKNFARPRCLAGTPVQLRNRIVEWALSESDQNVLWLNGVAGSGKSTVSTTIAEDMRELSRLATFIAFEREKSQPDTVIEMIAHGLASFHASIADAVIKAMDRDKNIVNASAEAQFDRLLLAPLSATAESVQGPVVIVLDALDECGTPSTRRPLLQLIRNRFQKLPKVFRFLITSRPERDIKTALINHPEFVKVEELDYRSETSQKDVLAYIRAEMQRVVVVESAVELPKEWQWDSNIQMLGKAADGLFIWASTAVKYVEASQDGRFRRLMGLVENSKSLGLDELYSTVLNACISWDEGVSKERFYRVLGLVLFSKIPLSSIAIDGILGYPPYDSSRSLLSGLQSVIEFTVDGSVRLFHASFADYLTDTKHASEAWFIDETAIKSFISERCFVTMEKMLRFNICGLEDSHVRNDEISDLQERIKGKIPPCLDYACRFWAAHLIDTPFSSERSSMLKNFLYTRFLYWLEVLSLLKRLSNAVPARLDAARWSRKHDVDVQAFLRDARNLVSLFYEPMSESTPHVYLSAIPLSPPKSRVAIHYMEYMSFLPLVKRLGHEQQAALVKVMRGHTSWVTCVALSTDGTRVVSGSDDKTVRVWDVESGQVVAAPFEGHTDWVMSVALSPDGSLVVSGSDDKTIRVWDIKSGQMVAGPFEGHTGWVRSVAFSSSGSYIVSGSDDKTIRVWNIQSGQVIRGPFEEQGGPVMSMALSPSGYCAVSGCDDERIRVRDLETGWIVAGPFEGHTDCVRSLAVSSDGSRIVSGSDDRTIRVWDVQSGRVVAGPFEGHAGSITSLALSSNGSFIVSSSDDETIRVWDLESGRLFAGPFEGHTDWVRCVALSSDGSRIVSGSDDMTIRVWDVESGRIGADTFEGHTDWVRSVALSSDGSVIISGSDDKTIRLWDVESGRLVGGPFEGHTGWIYSVALSSDGKRVVSGSYDKTILVWDVKSGQVVAGPFEAHTGWVYSVAFSIDGTRVVSGSEDRTIRVWDVESGQVVGGPFEGHTGAIRSVAFSSDGSRIVSGSDDKTIRVWNVQSGQVVGEPFEGHTGSIRSVALSSDGARVVSGSYDKTIRIWDVKGGQVVAGPFEGHRGSVNPVALSSYGSRIASGSDDKTIRVWDVKSGQAVAGPFEGHTDSVVSVALSSGGSRVISGSNDKTIRVWKIDDDDSLRPDLRDDSLNAVRSSPVVVKEPDSKWILDDAGWIRSGDDLLLWIPLYLRRGLYRPENTAIMSCPATTELDFSSFAHGKDWNNCFFCPA